MDHQTTHPSRRLQRAVLVAAAFWLAIAAMGGCSRTMVETRLRTDYSPSDMSSEMRFWHSLPGRAVVANDEALHGLIVLDTGKDPSRSYEGRMIYAREKGWVGENWSEPASQAVQRGVIARAVCIICGIRGGVMMHLLGPMPRYALRELMYMGIMSESSEQQTVSGQEFLGVVSKAKDYLETAKAAEPKPAEPKATKSGGA